MERMTLDELREWAWSVGYTLEVRQQAKERWHYALVPHGAPRSEALTGGGTALGVTLAAVEMRLRGLPQRRQRRH